MKKSLYITFILYILTSLLNAHPPEGPTISFVKTQVTFDSVVPDTLLRHTFKFRNSGTDTLVILNVRPG